MPKFLKNIFKFSSLSSSSNANEKKSFLDKSGLETLLKKIATKLNALDSMYPVGIVIELKKDVDPKNAIGGDWKDITSLYGSTNPNTKKWQRIIAIDSDKKNLQSFYNQVKDTKKEEYTEVSWKPFADALQNAKSVLDDSSAEQDTIDKAYSTLTTAFLMLRKKN